MLSEINQKMGPSVNYVMPKGGGRGVREGGRSGQALLFSFSQSEIYQETCSKHLWRKRQISNFEIYQLYFFNLLMIILSEWCFLRSGWLWSNLTLMWAHLPNILSIIMVRHRLRTLGTFSHDTAQLHPTSYSTGVCVYFLQGQGRHFLGPIFRGDSSQNHTKLTYRCQANLANPTMQCHTTTNGNGWKCACREEKTLVIFLHVSLLKKRRAGGQLIPNRKWLAQRRNWEKHRLLTYLVPDPLVPAGHVRLWNYDTALWWRGKNREHGH